MECGLTIGQEHTVERTVRPEDTAKARKSGLAQVFATPELVALMEQAALELAQMGLEEGFSTVGTEITTTHSAPTPVGMKVRAKAILTEIDRRKLSFHIEAYDEVEKIGQATHTRFIIENEKFQNKADAKKTR